MSEGQRFWDSDRFFYGCLAGFTLLAVGLRWWWTGEVQDPADTIYSDMKSYVTAARQAITGEEDPRDIYPSCFPYGMPWILAAQMRGFGLEAYGVMATTHALMGAAVTPMAMLTARRVFVSPVGFVLSGLATALWYPQLVYVGFFTSEVPFACAVTASLWLGTRFLQTGRGAVLTGLVHAIGFTIRPQLLLTAVLAMGLALWRRERLPHLDLRKLGRFVLPIALIVGFSSARHYAITGEVALISANGPLGRFFADTTYQTIKASQTLPSGRTRVKQFTPPARGRSNGFEGAFSFEGWRCDASKLDPERRRIVASKGWLYRPYLIRRNVRFLFFDNALWPERKEVKRPRWRKAWLERAAWLGFGLLPLSAWGLVTLVFRRNEGLELAGLHIATMVFAAAFYFGEVRYRVPYDAVLILLAVQGLLFFTQRKAEPQDRVACWVYGGLLGLLAVLVLVPWPPEG
ncbi:MAG: hypothetical protein AAF602_08880 [Myxococcota bacterium]